MRLAKFRKVKCRPFFFPLLSCFSGPRRFWSWIHEIGAAARRGGKARVDPHFFPRGGMPASSVFGPFLLLRLQLVPLEFPRDVHLVSLSRGSLARPLALPGELWPTQRARSERARWETCVDRGADVASMARTRRTAIAPEYVG